MAELAASLIGIIGAGTKVAMALSQVATDIGSAGKEPLIIPREIRSFCTIVRVLSQTLEGLHSEMTWSNRSECSESISDMMVVSKEMFTEILGLIDSIQRSSLSGSTLLSNSRFNMASRIKWLMNKPKFVFLRSALEAYKSNLSLLIGSIQLSKSRASDSPSTDSGDAILPQARTYRASLSISPDLRNIANEYQASMQEMETARLEIENEASHWLPPWESVPEGVAVAKSTTMNVQQDPHLREMIAAAKEEVQSLRPSSTAHSNSTASIYRSLSRHSTRISVMIDQLPVGDPLQTSKRRKSSALNVRNDIPTERRTENLMAAFPRLSASRPPGQSNSTFLRRTGDQPDELTAQEMAFKDLMLKYKNVKRQYWDQQDEIGRLNKKLSAAHAATKG